MSPTAWTPIFAGTLTVLVISGCKPREFNASNAENVTDATTLVQITDGVWSVTCRDGRTETHPIAKIRASMLNPDDQSVCPTPGSSGSGTFPFPGTGRRGFRCLARDNDGRPPWIIASVNAGVVTRWGTQDYVSGEVCNEIVGEINAGTSHICASRDLDNRAPYVLFKLGNNGPEKPGNAPSFGTRADCIGFFSSFRSYGGRHLSCWSRDFDNRTPFVIYQLDPFTASVVKYAANPTEYTTLADCRAILN